LSTNTYTAIYVRVSTEEQAQKGYSTKNQIDQLTQTTKKQGWKYRIFDDMGYSGTKYDRPGLTAMLDLVKEGKIERILVWKIDRLSRKLSHLLSILELLEGNKVELISISENFNVNTPMGKLLLGLLGSVAEFERDSIIQRIKAVKNTRKRVKRLPLGHVPYGLKLNEEKNKLMPDDGPGCEIVKKIFDLSLHGIGMVGIAGYLNDNGFRTKYGKRFDSSTIGRMLGNYTYAGMIEIDKELEHGNIDPIVTFDTYQEVRREIQKRTRTPSHPAAKHLLTGLLKCNVCGSGLVSTGNYKIGKRFYRCGRSANEGRSACPLKSFHAERIETSITDRLIETIEKDKTEILESMINGEAEYRNQEKTAAQNIQRLKTLIQKNIKSINKYFEMFESEFMDKAELKDRIEALKADNETCQNQISELKFSLPELDPLETRKQYETALENFWLILDLTELSEKRNLFQVIIEKITAYNDHLAVHLKTGYSFRVDYPRKIRRFTRTLADWEITALEGMNTKRAKAVLMANNGMEVREIAHTLEVDFSKIQWILKAVGKRGIASCFKNFGENQPIPFESFLLENIDTYKYLSFSKIADVLRKEGYSFSNQQLRNFWYRHFTQKTVLPPPA